MKYQITSESQMRDFGRQIGSLLRGGEVIDLVGDIGAGKTTLTQGIAVGLGVSEVVQSPTFTINKTYRARNNLELRHYDFYRLGDTGVMSNELAEAVSLGYVVVVVEWSGLIDGVLPDDKIKICFTAISQNTRELTIEAGGPRSRYILESLP